MNTATSHTLSSAQIAQDLPRLIERMHRRYLDVVRIELARHKFNDISPVQAMMLGTIGNEEISVRDMIERGYYLGSNASYNLKSLVDGGYVLRQASARDRRSALLKLSPKGREILEALAKLNVQMADSFIKSEGEGHDLEATYHTLRRLERRWTDAIRAEGSDTATDFKTDPNYGHFASGGNDINIASVWPPVFRPNIVPRS